MANGKGKRLDVVALLDGAVRKDDGRDRVIPEVASDPDVAGKVMAIPDAVAARDAALKALGELTDPVGAWGMAKVVAISTETGSPVATIRIDGVVDVTVRNAWSAVDADREGDVRAVVGDEFDRYFEREESVSLTPDGMKPSVLRKIAEAVGEANFAKYFQVSRCLRPTAEFHEDWLKSDEMRGAVAPLLDAGDGGKKKPVLKLASPSVKPTSKPKAK